MSGNFDVEHALNIFASSYSTLPARAIYDEHAIDLIRGCSEEFHIYLIGYTPKIDQKSFCCENGFFCINIEYFKQPIDVKLSVPPGFKFVQTGVGCYFVDENGEKRRPDPIHILMGLSRVVGGVPFKIKYIGQAYGEDGSRDAIDRLTKHETLQRIALRGVPDGWELQLILLEIQPGNRVFTVFLPNADNKDHDGMRRKMGIEKLFGTTDAERVSLYEASLIRYFAPEFNKEFKDSFPSTNLKLLHDCYQKDFLAVIAEICLDEFPFHLESESVRPKAEHIITHDLQKDDQRRFFFGIT